MIKGNTASAVLPFSLLRRVQHIFDKYAVAACGVGDENVSDGADELTVLHDGRSRHSLNYSAASFLENRVDDCDDEALIVVACAVDLRDLDLVFLHSVVAEC